MIKRPVSDNTNHAIVRVFLPYNETAIEPIKYTLDYYEPGSDVKHSTFVECNAGKLANNAQIKFSYTSPGQSLSQDIKISTIEVYLWYEDNASTPSWVAFNARGNNKFNVVFDYVERKDSLGSDSPSLFSTWTQNFRSFD